MNALVAYLSYSGNTKEVAEIIVSCLKRSGLSVHLHRIDIDSPLEVSNYQYLFLGTFTWGNGSTPEEMKEFVLNIGYKPRNIAIFGTGDTQFGDERFCKAVDKLVTFYSSQWPGLKIEQSPRGYQEEIVTKWVEGVLQNDTTITKTCANT